VSRMPIIIDCDPGHDDAIALLLALASPEVELLGVTTVAGNATLDKTTRNALVTLELAGRSDVPVAAGSEQPLRRPLVTAEHVHGTTGLDGPHISDPSTPAHALGAVPFLVELLQAAETPVTLIPVGPLTNIARLLTGHPEVIDRIERIVLMGGAIGLGNITPAAEFNIFVDPEAAAVVFGAPIEVTMIGLDVTHHARLGPAHADALRQAGRCGRFVAELLDYFIPNYRRRMGFDGAPIHDALAVARVIWPDLVSTELLAVEIDTTDGPSAGRTLVDRYRVTGRPPNVGVGMTVDSERFARLLVERISGLG
jgi:inosine-uridine nucleoside N-ribohydrolase